MDQRDNSQIIQTPNKSAIYGNERDYLSYPQRTYQPNATQQQIQNVQNMSKMNRKALKKYISDEVKKIKEKDHIEGYNPQQMLKQQGSDDVLQAIKDLKESLGSGVTSQEAGLSYQQKQKLNRDIYAVENELLQEKTNFVPSAANLQTFLKSIEYTNPISHKKLRELLLLDDWKTDLAQYAIPIILQHGPPAIDYLWQKFTGALKNRFPGNDWGGSVADYGSNPSKDMIKVARVPDLTYGLQNNPRIPRSISLYDSAVDVDFISSLLCPEDYSASLPDTFHSSCTTISSSAEYLVSTNAQGNSFAYFNPGQPCNAVNASPQLNYVFGNPTTYNTITGAYTGGVGTEGPLTTAAGLDSYRLVSCAVQFVPLLSSNNNSGQVSLSAWYSYPIGNTAYFQQFISLQGFTSSLSYVCGNMNTTYRQATQYTSSMSSCAYYAAASQQEASAQFFLKIDSAAPSTNIGKAYIYYNYQVRFQPTARQFVNAMSNTSSVATQELAVNLGTKTGLFMQQYEDIKRIVAPLQTGKFTTYGQVSELLMAQSNIPNPRTHVGNIHTDMVDQA